MSRRHHLLGALLAAGLLGAPVAAAAAGQDALKAPVGDQALDQMRGGFVVVDGLTFDFGAQISSYVDGQLALQSNLSLDNKGVGLDQATIGAAAAAALANLAAGGVKLNSAGGNVYVTPSGDAAFIHRVQDGQLANVLVNTGDNHAFRQDLSLTLTLPGFQAVQNGVAAARLGGDLVDQVSRFSARMGQ